MSHRIAASLALVVAVVLVPGCGGKKKPKTTEDLSASTVSSAPAAPATDVKPSVRPDTGDDRLHSDPLKDPDLAKINGFVRAQGLLGDVYFDFDRFELRAEARERLAKNAEWLKSHPEFFLTLEGHCDERGTNEYNLALGERRAAAARDYIISLGVSATRLRTISYGEERPQCTQPDESCWAQNRRAHFLISGRTNVG